VKQSVTPVCNVKQIAPVSQSFLSKPPPQGRSPDGFSPHVQTRITDLHSKNVFGEGVKVAFIDSGVDCEHPALGKGFGPGYKIGFGYDLVGDDYDGSNAPVPDSNPCTPCGVSL
jgi:subtilisin family serine protease